jgi:PEGA domain
MRAAARLAPIAALLACACQPPDSPERPTVSLRMRGTPPDAMVVVDDQSIGTLDLVAAHGVALPPGVHHITVRAPGYFPMDREVDAKLGTPPTRIDVALTPVPD